jgi:glycosyltransferase involved in cell wall biosynthesis
MISANPSRVSVVVPNYNRANLIGETIENLLSQTLPPDELIVVDDGSTDDSVAVIKAFGSKVKLICQPNQGPGAARNAGLKTATGDYIQFFDSDDLCSLNKLEAQARVLEESGADIAYSPWVPASIESRQVRIDKHVFQQRALPQNLNPLTCFLRGWVSVFQALMFRRSFLQKVGKYRTDLMPSEDSEFLFRMLLRQPEMRFTPDCLVLYRSHTGGQITGSGTSSSHRAQDWHNFMEIVELELTEHQVDLDLYTRFKFAVRKWKSAQYLSGLTVGDSSRDVDQTVCIPIYQKLAFQTFDFFERLESRVRTKTMGAGYPQAYATDWITPHQLELIQKMGYVPKKFS